MVSLEGEDTQARHEDGEGEIPARGECVTLSFFVQVAER